IDRALGAFVHLADLGDLAVLDRDIGLVAPGAGAVDHGAVLDNEVVAHRFLPGMPRYATPAAMAQIDPVQACRHSAALPCSGNRPQNSSKLSRRCLWA